MVPRVSHVDCNLEDKACLREGIYQVQGGPKNNFLFCFAFGHKRPFLSFEHYRADLHGPITFIDPAIEQTIPYGPYMPTDRASTIKDAFGIKDIDLIREVLCADLTGNGYEIGAGSRPTCTPFGCNVAYIDKFTFEQATDGSFISTDPRHLVKVSIYSDADDLREIREDSSDFFIACHVMEHVHSVIPSIRNLHRKLKSGGKIILIIPDKRYMFDVNRPTTTLEHLISEDIAPNHNLLEHYLEYARRSLNQENWVDAGLRYFQRRSDFHCHTFTPDSFRELLKHIDTELHFAEYNVFEHDHPAEMREFYTHIIK